MFHRELTEQVTKELEGIFGSKNVRLDEPTRRAFSLDYSWFSPLLKKSVEHALCDAVVFAEHTSQIRALLELAHEKRIPVVVRGAGTGNYAQCVPLKGGVVLDITRIKAKIEFEANEVFVEPGVRLGELKSAAEKRALTLRTYPSTYIVSTVSGYIGGGSGGVGSVEFGRLWEGNVSQVVLATPVKGEILIKGKALLGVIHAAGTTGVATQIGLPLCEKPELVGFVSSFKTLEDSVSFSLELAKTKGFLKRVVTLFEPAIVRFFARSVKDRVFKSVGKSVHTLFDQENYAVIAIFEKNGENVVSELLAKRALSTEWLDDDEAEKLTDYTFNHTTLWAAKQEQRVTWLLFGLPDDPVHKIKKIKQKYQDKILLHLELHKVRDKDERYLLALPLVFYDTPEELLEITGFLRSIGCEVENIHSYYLDDRLDNEKLEAIKAMKRENDPRNVLNPGKIKGF